MRTLCVAVVVLSLSSAAAGPLACDELLKPVEKRPDDNSSETNNQTVVVHVVWHLVRYSHVLGQLRDCGVFSELPSVSVNVTAQAKANIYAANLKIKLNDSCATEPQPFSFLENNTIFIVHGNDTPTSGPEVLLLSGCPDCLVVRRNNTINGLLLISRRKNVAAAELKEFETQADCLAWYKPLILNTKHACGGYLQY